MTHLTIRYPSDCLRTFSTFEVYLPKKATGLMGEVKTTAQPPFRTMILLHGAADDPMAWVEQTSVARMADEEGFALILPNGLNSFYINNPAHERFFDFIVDELIDYAREILPLSDRREDTFVGGISMGGYGAVRMALMRPERFGKAFSLSGALNIQPAYAFMRATGGIMPNPFNAIAKKVLAGTEYDLFPLLEQYAKEPWDAVPLYISCGEQDFFNQFTIEFEKRALEAGYPVTRTSAPGEHTWDFWRESIGPAIRWCLE